jgi:hypothetical protein
MVASPERGSSLIGVLAVVIVLGVMAAIAAASLGGLSPGTPGGSTADSLLGLTGNSGLSADRIACLADYSRVLLADKAYAAKTGSGAATIGALLVAGDLSKAPGDSRGYTIGLASAAGKPTGAVTVNGVPGIAACADL